MKGNGHNVYENTLLIVESPTVAKIIEDFDLPYLSLIATKGFCWKPKYNRSEDKLKLSAVDGKRDIRNKIRDESRWATQVVVATDADASGDLIAYSIYKHLKRFDIDLKRAYLGGLSPSEIPKCIQSAQPLSAPSLTRRLKNRYKWLHILQKHSFPGNIPRRFKHAILAICGVFYGDIPFYRFMDSAGNTYISDESIRVSYGDKISVQKDIIDDYYQQWYPPNTFDILSLMSENLGYKTFKAAQQDLNHLFTRVPAELYSGLISYPRTKSRSFYPSTWRSFENQWIKSNTFESLISRQLRSITPDKTAHEAIHPLRLEYTPKDIRPFVRKKFFDIYRLIYDRHLEVLRRPNRFETTRLKGGNCKKSFYRLTPVESLSQQKFHVEPIITIEDLLKILMDYKVIRPSKVGKFADFILSEKYISIDSNNMAYPGNKLKSILSLIEDFSQLNDLLRTVKKQLDSTFDAEMISNRLTSILNG